MCRKEPGFGHRLSVRVELDRSGGFFTVSLVIEFTSTGVFKLAVRSCLKLKHMSLVNWFTHQVELGMTSLSLWLTVSRNETKNLLSLTSNV